MNNLHHKPLSIVFLMVLIGNISACSTVRGVFSAGEEINYQDSQSTKILDVPADLTTPNFDNAFALSQTDDTGNSSVDISPPKLEFSSGSTVVEGSKVSSRIINASGRALLKVNGSHSNSLLATEENLKKMGFEITGKTSELISAKFTESVVLVNETSVSSLLKHVVDSDGKRLVKYEAALEQDVVYLVTVSNEANGPSVRFARADNEKISDAAHTKIIQLLHASFNS